MSLSISFDVSGKELKENVTCHLIPCKVSHNGTCNVSKYLDPYIRDRDNVLSCSLRGHPLQGQKIKIPDGYKGVILKEKKLLTDENRELEATGLFKEFSFWNWDKVPSDEDKIVKALQWMDVASALHKPVSEHEDFEIESFKTGIKRKQSESDI